MVADVVVILRMFFGINVLSKSVWSQQRGRDNFREFIRRLTIRERIIAINVGFDLSALVSALRLFHGL